MGVVASKFAFMPPNPARELNQKCQYITTLSKTEIPTYFRKHHSSEYIVIFSHGNAEDLTGCIKFCDNIFEKFHVSVFAYEYVGYPHTRPSVPSSITPILTPSEQGCYESIYGAHYHVLCELGYPEDKQIWLGQSIGSGPTVDLVAFLGKQGVKTAGMILISPFYSAVSTVSPFLSNFYDMFCNGSKISNVTAPTLIIHGSIDDVVPQTHSADLMKNCNCEVERVLIQGAGHNDLFLYQETFTALENFFQTIFRTCHLACR